MTDAKGWDSYWQTRQQAKALTTRPGNADPLLAFWQQFFNDYGSEIRQPEILELA